MRVQLQDGVLDARISRERLFTSTTYIFVLWMVGTSLVLFAVATLFMRNQVRPIRRLARAMDLFGKGREVADFKPAGAAEVRQAAAAFNAMRDSHPAHDHPAHRDAGRRQPRSAHAADPHEAAARHDRRRRTSRRCVADVAEMERMLGEYLAFARGEGTEAARPTDLGDVLTEVVDGARRQGANVELRLAAGAHRHRQAQRAQALPRQRGRQRDRPRAAGWRSPRRGATG